MVSQYVYKHFVMESKDLLIILIIVIYFFKALRRLFDAVILCGADMFLYAAVSIWGVFEKYH